MFVKDEVYLYQCTCFCVTDHQGWSPPPRFDKTPEQQTQLFSQLLSHTAALTFYFHCLELGSLSGVRGKIQVK